MLADRAGLMIGPLGNMVIYCADGDIDKVIIALIESH